MADPISVRSWLAFLRTFLRAHPRFTAALVVSGLALLSLGAGLSLGTWRTVCRDCPSIAQIYAWEPQQATKIFAADGELIAELFQQRRTPVSLDALPPYVPQAFIAIEDKRFYRHEGLDYLGITRAFVNNLIERRIAGGGSTITQQLARHMFIQELGFEQHIVRKLKEAKVALELEQAYTKEQILEAYINQINYGSGWYGIETAAQRFFGKPATELNPAEAALLAAVINLPEYYSPFRHPERARSRRNLVLDLMADQGYLEAPEADRWKREPLPERPSGVDDGQLAPYFIEWVRDLLDDRYGSDLYRSGFRVYTTLDVSLQQRALEAMEAGWRRIESQEGFAHPKYAAVKEAGGSPSDSETPYLQGMFLVLDPRTGEIKAMIGGRDFEDSKFNRATQARRQPGSVFKPFVYTAAIASGIPASHVIYDSPIMLEQEDGTTWAPRNYTGDFRGPLTLREALRRSTNVVAVKLALEVGLETVVQYARQLGIATPIPRFPSTAIGAASVIPLEIAEAYTAFATQGIRVTPRAILRVEDATGRVLWATEPQAERVLDTATASIILELLRDVVDRGSAYSIRDPLRGNVSTQIPAAGKTGTTNDATDVWFVGFTPDLLAAVWFGFDTPTEILPNAAGGAYAAPVWADFMKSVYWTTDSTAFPMDSAGLATAPPIDPGASGPTVPADSVGRTTDWVRRPPPPAWELPPELITRQVDRESGKLATDWCPIDLVYTEVFLPGTEPTEACDIHGPGIFGAPLRGVLPDTMPSDSAPVSDAVPDSLRIMPRIRF